VKAADRTAPPEARIDVDALTLAVERLDGKLPPEEIAYLRSLTGLLVEVREEVREELRSDDASMDQVRRLLRRVRVTR
jgi:hypothetical protein